MRISAFLIHFWRINISTFFKFFKVCIAIQPMPTTKNARTVRSSTKCDRTLAQKTIANNSAQSIDEAEREKKTFECRLKYTTAITQIRKVIDSELFVAALMHLRQLAKITSRHQLSGEESARHRRILIMMPTVPKYF